MAVRAVNQHPDVADILLRVSTQTQAGDERFSLPTQEAACRAFAAKRRWGVHSVEQDAITGETVHRPGFQAVLEDLRAGRVGRVIVYDVDRAGRDTYVGATLLHECKEAGATLHIEQMPDLELGGEGPTAYMAETMFFWRLTQSAQELAGIRERTQRGRRARVQSGKPLIGAVPLYGYTFVTDARGDKVGYTPHPVYASVVARIFAEVAAGDAVTVICARLTSDGVPTRSQAGLEASRPGAKRRVSGTWHPAAIAAIIWNPAYSGQPVANRHQITRAHGVDAESGRPRTRATQRLRPRADAAVVPLSTDVWPPLVTPELAATARKRLAANQEEAARRMARVNQEDTLLRGGYAYCFDCGRPLTTERYKRPTAYGGAPYWVYRCKHNDHQDCNQSMVAHTLDRAVWAHVIALAEDEAVAEEAMAAWYARFAHAAKRRAAALKTAEAVCRAAARDEEQARRTLTEETNERYRARLRMQWQEAVDHLEASEQALAALQAQQANDAAERQYADVRAWASDWRRRVRDMSYHEQRQALHRLGLRVFVWPTETGQHEAGPRRFTVVLGWPQGVKQAVPGTVTPRGLEGTGTGTGTGYSAEYLPGLEVDTKDEQSEIARLVPIPIDGDGDAATEPGAPETGLGQQLGGAMDATTTQSTC